MKKIIRLTEKDLTRIVRRVIREQDEIEVGEGFLSNLFGGGKKKDEKTTSNSNYGSQQKTVKGIEFDEIYVCKGFSGTETKFYTHYDGTTMAFVSPGIASGSRSTSGMGLNTSGDACSFSETGYNKY